MVKKRMNGLDYLAIVLLVIGGINWGLFGVFDVDLVALLASVTFELLGTIIYGAIGLAGLYGGYFLVKQAMK